MAIMGKTTTKYLYTPLTAEQISAGVGVTKKDKALVKKVLTDLGYVGEKSVKTRTANSPKPARKSE